MQLRALVTVGVLAAGVASCGSRAVEPTSTLLDVVLTTPNVDDGAVMFTISGGPVTSIQAFTYRTYTGTVSSNTYRVMVTGNVNGGILVRVLVPDASRAGDYVTTVNQVARRGTYQQRTIGGYSLRLGP